MSQEHDPDAADLILVGRIRTAHGLKGELVVEPLTDAPDATFASGRRLFAGTVDGERASDGAVLHVVRSRPFKEGWLVLVAEITDRTQAELWRQRYLLVPRDELEPPGEDEVYVHDLIGLDVRLPAGDRVGSVIGTFDLPQGLMLDVQLDGRSARDSVLIPFHGEVVREVDVAGGHVVIDPPDGLLG